MRALVLGGSVFVGRRLVRLLAAQGHDVAVLNRGQTATDLPEGVRRLTADRTSAEQLAAVLGGTEWDAVFDVSGFVMVAGGADINVLLDLLDGRVGGYVYVSSIMAYEPTGWFPWTEDGPVRAEGKGTYGGFKVMSEQALLARHAASGFPASVVRPAAIYGPDNNIYDMEAAMFSRLRQHRPVLVPHGGLVTGSYGHVDDLCEAMVACATIPAAHGEVFNITAEGLTVNQYVSELAAIVGVEPDVVQVPDPLLSQIAKPGWGHLLGVAHHGTLSIAKAERLMGWTPRRPFRPGHEETYEWFLAQGYGERTEPLADPVWYSTWDFDNEAAIAALVRG
jgi:nucleoside-diphosphate-sugar epimerase